MSAFKHCKISTYCSQQDIQICSYKAVLKVKGTAAVTNHEAVEIVNSCELYEGTAK